LLTPVALRSKAMACSRFIGRVFESPEVMDIRLLCLSCRYRPLRRAYHLFRGVLLSLCVCGIVCDVETSAETVQAQFGIYRLKQQVMLYSGCSYSVYVCSELCQEYRTNVILF